MMYQFGDKLVNTYHVHAIGEPYFSSCIKVDLYFIGGRVVCEFGYIEDEWNEMGKRTDEYLESKIYKRVLGEVDKLKYLIERKL